MRSEQLTAILKNMNGGSSDIEASAIFSTDGLMMASALPCLLDKDRLGAMSSAMASLGDRVSRELDRGQLEQILVMGEGGYVLVVQAGDDAVLTVITRADSKLGMVFLDARRAAAQVAILV